MAPTLIAVGDVTIVDCRAHCLVKEASPKDHTMLANDWASNNRPAADCPLSHPDTQVSKACISAAATVLVTRLGTTNNGSTCVGRLCGTCCQLAVNLGPFRRHQMTILETIIAVLHCLSNGRHVGLCAFV